MFGLTVANDNRPYKLSLTCPTEHNHDDIVAKRNFNFTKSLYGRFNTIGYTGSLNKVNILEKKKKKVKNYANMTKDRVLNGDKSQENLAKQKEEIEEKIENIKKLKQLKRERQRIRKYKYHLYINAKIIQRAWKKSRISMKQNAVALIISMIKNHQYKRAISVGATAASIIKRFAIYASLRYIAYKEGLLRKGIEKMLSNQLSTNFINNDIIPTIVSHVVSVSVAKHKKSNKIITSSNKTKSGNDKRRQSITYKSTPKGKNVKNISGKSFDGNVSAFLTEAKIETSIINAAQKSNIINPNGVSSKIVNSGLKAEILTDLTVIPKHANSNNNNDSNGKNLNNGIKSPKNSSNSSYVQSSASSDKDSSAQDYVNISSNSSTSIKSNSSTSNNNNTSEITKNNTVINTYNANLRVNIPEYTNNAPSNQKYVGAKLEKSVQYSKSTPTLDMVSSNKSTKAIENFDTTTAQKHSNNNRNNNTPTKLSLNEDKTGKKVKTILSKNVKFNELPIGVLPPLKPKVPSLSELHIVKSKDELQKELEKREKVYEIREKELERELLRRQLYKDEKLMKERELRIKVVESRKLEKDREDREKELELAEIQRQKDEKKKQYINNIMKLQLERAKIIIDKQKQLNSIRKLKVDEDNRIKQELLAMRKEDILMLSKYEMKRIKVHSYTPIIPLHSNKNNDDVSVDTNDDVDDIEDDEDNDLTPEELAKLKAIKEAKKQKEAADKARMEALEVARKERLKHKIEEDKRIKLEADELLKKREYIRQQLILQQQEVLMNNINNKKKHEEYLKKQEEKNKQKQEMKLKGAPLPDETLKKAEIDPDDYIEGEDEGDDPFVFNKFITDEFKFSEFLDSAESINIEPIVDKSNKKSKVPPDERRKPKVAIPAVLKNTPYYNDYKLVVKNLPLPVKSSTKKSKIVDGDIQIDINSDVNDEDSVNSAASSSLSSLNSINSSNHKINTNSKKMKQNILPNKSMTNDPIIPFAQFIKAGPPVTTLSHIVPKNNLLRSGNETVKSKVDDLYKSKQQEALQNSMQFLITRNITKINPVDEDEVTLTRNNDVIPANDEKNYEVEIDNDYVDDGDDDSSVNTNGIDEKHNLYDNGNYQGYIDEDYEKALDEECEYLTNLLKNKIDNKIN